jgi:hypothetical protein
VRDDDLAPREEDVVSTYRPWGYCLEVRFFENIMVDAVVILPRSTFMNVKGFPTTEASWEFHEFLLRACFRGYELETFPEALVYLREICAEGRPGQDDFPRFQSLFERLSEASHADLARIVALVGGPTLVAHPGRGSGRRGKSHGDDG